MLAAALTGSRAQPPGPGYAGDEPAGVQPLAPLFRLRDT